jgi:hypothetical protein
MRYASMDDVTCKLTTDPDAIERIEELRNVFSQAHDVTVKLTDGNTFKGRSSYGAITRKNKTGQPEQIGGYVRVRTQHGEMTIDSLDIESWTVDS